MSYNSYKIKISFLLFINYFVSMDILHIEMREKHIDKLIITLSKFTLSKI